MRFRLCYLDFTSIFADIRMYSKDLLLLFFFFFFLAELVWCIRKGRRRFGKSVCAAKVVTVRSCYQFLPSCQVAQVYSDDSIAREHPKQK